MPWETTVALALRYVRGPRCGRAGMGGRPGSAPRPTSRSCRPTRSLSANGTKRAQKFARASLHGLAKC